MSLEPGCYYRSREAPERWIKAEGKEERNLVLSTATYLQVKDNGVRIQDISEWRYRPGDGNQQWPVLYFRHGSGWSTAVGDMATEVYEYLARNTVLVVTEEG